MDSEELAKEVGLVHAEALSRILHEGHVSYARRHDFSQEHQDFEFESLEDELTNLEEELLDTINWASMAILKLRERRAKANRPSA